MYVDIDEFELCKPMVADPDSGKIIDFLKELACLQKLKLDTAHAGKIKEARDVLLSDVELGQGDSRIS